MLSPLAPQHTPELPPIRGVQLAVGNSGLKYVGRPDVLYVSMNEGTAVAGVFTQSATASAAVQTCRKSLESSQGGRALVVNAGNANAFTGDAGQRSVDRIVHTMTNLSACKIDQCFTASTGVIGETLDDAAIANLLEQLQGQLKPSGWQDAATAITTTDTFPKLATITFEIEGKSVTINGIAKGSGMIAPNMATMLAFFFTDCAIVQPLLQHAFARANEPSFNSITVDGDTSTSDTALLFATGAAGHPLIEDEHSPSFGVFSGALHEIMLNLAQQIVRDGEGATKFITVEVTGAQSDQSAKNIALSIANSPLVKTAIAGEDANWGRVVMAVGKAGEPVDQRQLSICFGGQLAAKDGQLNADYNEAAATEHLKGQEIELSVDIGWADGQARIYTTDLTHGYISINADYRS